MVYFKNTCFQKYDLFIETQLSTSFLTFNGLKQISNLNLNYVHR